MARKIIIGTRGSNLALRQAEITKDLLASAGFEAEIKIIETEGDRSQQWETSLQKMEGKGFFTKELEEELLKKKIDLAVHSHKDLPVESPDGLMIGGVSRREDPSEYLIINKKSHDDKLKFGLKDGSSVGTSSPRRKAQLLAFRPDLKMEDIRGNVPTRIEKLRQGKFDALMLAAAGIERLQLPLDDFHVEKISPREIVPAPAQGVLAWQIREDDDELLSALDQISDFDALVKCNIERQLLAMLEGGCHLPLGVYCENEPDDEDRLRFRVWVSLADAWDKQPYQLYFETLDTDGFTDRMYDHIKAIKPKKVFITRNFRSQDYFRDSLTKLGFSVTAQSLIEFRPIKIRELPQTDWIFFSSKHGVRYFFSQKPKIGNVKFGCIGTATSAELRANGHRADFIGQSNDTKLVGKQFSSKIGNARVLFPVARGSRQSIQWQMVKRENVFNLEVYATIKHSAEISSGNEVIVFTSPSNVEAFFEKNRVAPGQRIVAMGDATGNALKLLKIKEFIMPQSFDDLGLVQAVLGVSN